MTHAQAPSTEEQMLGRQAKIVSPATLRLMLAYARQARQPKRDTVIVLLSVKAGLRACEIAGLQWSMVMTDNSKIGDVIDIRDTIAKRGAGRRIPMHSDLQRSTARWPPIDRHPPSATSTATRQANAGL
jgi:integrase